MKKLTRKTFFKGLALGTISLPFAIRALGGKGQAQSESNGAPNVITAQKYRWKMVTTWPPKFPVLGEACDLYANIARELSGGRLDIRVYGGNELVPPLEAFDTVRGGGAELGCGAAYYWAGKSEAAQFFAAVPFGMNAQQLNAWMASGGLALWEELYADFNLIPMPGGNTGVQMGGWFNKEINSLADLRGLKMRIPGLGGKVLERAGGAPVLMAGSEIYTGLERGVIDATEWLGPYHDSLMGFHEIAKYYYTPGWHEPGTMLEFFVNKQLFETLPSDLQQVIKVTSGYVAGWVLSQMEARNAQALGELVDMGIDIRSFPADVMQQMRQYTEEAIADIVARDPFSRKVYESYRRFERLSANYALITERAYYNEIQAQAALTQ
jgi:TRAP-type mannitol/chloroaromatic compound transport system substrate-binding protein